MEAEVLNNVKTNKQSIKEKNRKENTCRDLNH